MKNRNQRKQQDKLEVTVRTVLRATGRPKRDPRHLKLLVLNKIAPGLRIMPLGIEKKNKTRRLILKVANFFHLNILK